MQGACGVYSFYTAVQILRAINPKNPAVPSPKKSESGPTDVPGKSLREYCKRQFKSGQGEILNDSEMSRLIAASGYMPLSFGRAGGPGLDAKKDFLEMCNPDSERALRPRAEHDSFIWQRSILRGSL